MYCDHGDYKLNLKVLIKAYGYACHAIAATCCPKRLLEVLQGIQHAHGLIHRPPQGLVVHQLVPHDALLVDQEEPAMARAVIRQDVVGLGGLLQALQRSTRGLELLDLGPMWHHMGFGASYWL